MPAVAVGGKKYIKYNDEDNLGTLIRTQWQWTNNNKQQRTKRLKDNRILPKSTSTNTEENIIQYDGPAAAANISHKNKKQNNTRISRARITATTTTTHTHTLIQNSKCWSLDGNYSSSLFPVTNRLDTTTKMASIVIEHRRMLVGGDGYVLEHKTLSHAHIILKRLKVSLQRVIQMCEQPLISNYQS